ncbi:MAG: hypothetical protein V9F01_07840 [Chitinophagaceae bacterium]
MAYVSGTVVVNAGITGFISGSFFHFFIKESILIRQAEIIAIVFG